MMQITKHNIPIFLRCVRFWLLASVVFLLPYGVSKAEVLGDGPALDPNLITQGDIENGALSLSEIRNAGKLVFTTPYNRYDGLGDGPPDANKGDFTQMGNRPGLQNRFTPFLRVNGLDAQTCLECHSVLSRAEIPMTFAIGGHGGLNNNPIFLPKTINVSDLSSNDHVSTDGRFINPPFLFGAGGVELVAKEMTSELQAIKQQAEDAESGTKFPLISKGVHFGDAISNGDGTVTLELDGEGHAIDEDLTVRPFGRKGEFFSVRDFDRGAMQFHFGMQATELVGEDTDPDGDGVTNEVTVGQLSALSTFLVSMPPPKVARLSRRARQGARVFKEIGCSTCHVPAMHTEVSDLALAYPDDPSDPSANTYLSLDLSQPPMRFPVSDAGGIVVRMFSDFKRHDMGPDLAESTGAELDSYFLTARLWGVADSAPYLHDGRAPTLMEAVLAHGGEADEQRDNFAGLTDKEKNDVFSFLRALRVPSARAISRLTH